MSLGDMEYKRKFFRGREITQVGKLGTKEELAHTQTRQYIHTTHTYHTCTPHTHSSQTYHIHTITPMHATLFHHTHTYTLSS